MNDQVPDVFGSEWCHRPAIMPTTTSPLTPAAHGLRVAASFNPFYLEIVGTEAGKDLQDEDDWGGRINDQRPTVRTITLKEDFPANLVVLTSRSICGRALSSALHHIYETYKNLWHFI